MEKILKNDIKRIEKQKGFARRLKILLALFCLDEDLVVEAKNIIEITGYSTGVVSHELSQFKREGFAEALYEGENIAKFCRITEKGKEFLIEYIEAFVVIAGLERILTKEIRF